jgi:hypothetical protein
LARITSLEWVRNPAESHREFGVIVTDPPNCAKISKPVLRLQVRVAPGGPEDWMIVSDIIVTSKVIGTMGGSGDEFLSERRKGLGIFVQAASWEAHRSSSSDSRCNGSPIGNASK